MDETKKPSVNRLSEQLPTHAPDQGSWQRISAKLDMLDAESVFSKKLANLPVHSPDAGTWNTILFRLNRAAYIKTGVRIALSAAAILLLFFAVSRVIDTNENNTPVPALALKEQPEAKTAAQNQNITPQPAQIQNQNQHINTVSNRYKTNRPPSAVAESAHVETESAFISSENEIARNQDIAIIEIDTVYSLAQEIALQEPLPAVEEIAIEEENSPVSVLQKQAVNTAITPPVKYYTPKDPQDSKSNNNFALGMYYLPENIDNGDGTSLFHNVNVTASYNKEKVRYNTSLGMAYNEEQLVFEMNYDINTPVMGTGADGQLDTLGYRVDKMESQYEGTEKHQYFTYNLGLGRKLFSAGKFSSWISAGAGFGIRLNDPDIISSTENSIKGQYNAQITSVQASKPEYNDVYVNFVTGIDLNYKLLKRLSFTFTPTSLWYFKPVLTKDNQPTDELTLGFKTGMKFDF